jgi:predicted NUDIX family NTP pyrophosphohydrolase
MKQSSGLLLYRRPLSVLLVHPSGPYNRKAPWSIPKGWPDEGEELEAAARRETREETGIDYTGALTSLGSIDYTKSRKRVYCFAAEVSDDVEAQVASWEIDKAEFLPIERAKEVIHPDQRAVLERLVQRLDEA